MSSEPTVDDVLSPYTWEHIYCGMWIFGKLVRGKVRERIARVDRLESYGVVRWNWSVQTGESAHGFGNLDNLEDAIAAAERAVYESLVGYKRF